MSIIKTEMVFKGSHADNIRRLKSVNVFSSAIEIVILAAMIGLDKNLSKPVDPMSSNTTPFKVEAEAILNNEQRLSLAYAAVALYHDESMDFKQAADSFFRAREPEHWEQFMSFIRGGIDYLYETLLASSESDLARVLAISKLFDEFSDYMITFRKEVVQKLANEALGAK